MILFCVKCIRFNMEATDGWWRGARGDLPLVIHKGESLCEEHFMEVVESE